MKGTKCMNKVFAVRQMYKKNLENGKYMLLVFINLGKSDIRLVDMLCSICYVYIEYLCIYVELVILALDPMECFALGAECTIII